MIPIIIVDIRKDKIMTFMIKLNNLGGIEYFFPNSIKISFLNSFLLSSALSKGSKFSYQLGTKIKYSIE